MNSLLLAASIIICGALLSLLFRRSTLTARLAAPVSVVIGAGLGIFPAIDSLISGTTLSLHLKWQIPFGSMNLGLDPLSAFFIIPILLVSALSAIYGVEYLKKYETARVGLQWFFFNLLVVSMLFVVLARNVIPFLLAWEVMSLSSFFLVMFESEKEKVRHAGWVYLVAMHIGTAFLLMLFMLLANSCGSLDFDKFNIDSVSQIVVAVMFLLAVIGFGTKAGFMPMHVWLPEAHPAAPSHVSAVMSGVMIKTGIYGIIRILTYLGTPPDWWGWTLIIIGATSGILGVLFALAQHDLKRLFAFCSIENIGIISLGLGIGILGVSYGSNLMLFMGFGGALLHVLNHALFKSLLFLSAGAVLHTTGTVEIDHLGGLIKKMPVTALVFIIGSIAICGLPPLNGFVSEFFIYVGSLSAVIGRVSITNMVSVAGLVVAASLALIGGLAVACFTKAFGIVFLGEGRSQHVNHAHEVGIAMRIPMLTLALLCLIIGLAGPFVPDLLMPVISNMIPLNSGSFILPSLSAPVNEAFVGITIGAFLLIVFTIAAAILRSYLGALRRVYKSETWGCGYIKATPRMQYTSSSFAAPITKLLKPLLGTRQKFNAPCGLFPDTSSFSSETPDIYSEQLYKPIFVTIDTFLARFRWIQHGRLNLYILCIVVALIFLLVWKLG